MDKIIMIYDQIQAGAGTKDDKMVPLKAVKEAVGPAVMMEKFLKDNNQKVIACLYCGNGTYLEQPQEVVRKLTALIQKVKADGVICGPCFNYHDYALMAADVADTLQKQCDIPVVALMSKENEDVIAKYKDTVDIVKCPKKGEVGLNQALDATCKLLAGKIHHQPADRSVCF